MLNCDAQNPENLLQVTLPHLYYLANKGLRWADLSVFPSAPHKHRAPWIEAYKIRQNPEKYDLIAIEAESTRHPPDHLTDQLEKFLESQSITRLYLAVPEVYALNYESFLRSHATFQAIGLITVMFDLGHLLDVVVKIKKLADPLVMEFGEPG